MPAASLPMATGSGSLVQAGPEVHVDEVHAADATFTITSPGRASGFGSRRPSGFPRAPNSSTRMALMATPHHRRSSGSPRRRSCPSAARSRCSRWSVARPSPTRSMVAPRDVVVLVGRGLLFQRVDQHLQFGLRHRSDELFLSLSYRSIIGLLERYPTHVPLTSAIRAPNSADRRRASASTHTPCAIPPASSGLVPAVLLDCAHESAHGPRRGHPRRHRGLGRVRAARPPAAAADGDLQRPAGAICHPGRLQGRLSVLPNRRSARATAMAPAGTSTGRAPTSTCPSASPN